MNLTDLLNKFPNITLATEEDNQEILAFYHGFELKNNSDSVIYKRDPDFFAFLKERSSKFLVFLLRDNELNICGLGSISFRTGYIHQKKTIVGYLGDLRVSLHRKLIKQWRKFYSSLIQFSPEMPETFYCKYYQTALIETNQTSKNNLLNRKLQNIKYNPLATYHMLNIIGEAPLINRLRTRKFFVDFATENDKEIILQILAKDHQKKLFGHSFPEELEHKLKCLSHFSLKNFLVIRTSQEKAVGVSYIWNPIKNKQLLINKIPKNLQLLHKMAKWVPGFYLKPLPKKNTPIHCMYLGQISFCSSLEKRDRLDCFKLLCHFVLRHPSLKFNMLAYCDFKNNNFERALWGFIYNKVKMGLYTVHHIDDNQNLKERLGLLKPHETPAFDMETV